MSFSGIYGLEWNALTLAKFVSSACVFFPTGSKQYGTHCDDYCQCEFLYLDVEPAFNGKWGGKAPFGCFWFQQWKKLCDCCVACGQTIIVVTKRRADWAACKVNPRPEAEWTNDLEGVGNSQKGEIKYVRKALRRHHPGKSEDDLEEMIVFVDDIVDEYRRLAILAELGLAHDYEGRREDAQVS